MNTLIKVSEGDLRKSIMMLQTSTKFYDNNITVEAVNEISGIVPQEVIESLYKASRTNQIKKIEEAVKEVMYEGFDVLQVLKQLQDYTMAINKEELPDIKKARLSEFIAQAELRLNEGKLNLFYK